MNEKTKKWITGGLIAVLAVSLLSLSSLVFSSEVSEETYCEIISLIAKGQPLSVVLKSRSISEDSWYRASRRYSFKSEAADEIRKKVASHYQAND